MTIKIQSYMGTPQNHKLKANVKRSNSVQTVPSEFADRKNMLVDRNFNALIVNSNKVSFTSNLPSTDGVSAGPSDGDMPLAVKINGLIPKLMPSELIVVSKDLKKAKEDMVERISAIPNATTRIYFIKDDNIERTDGFRMNEVYEAKEVINFDKSPLAIMRPATPKDDNLKNLSDVGKKGLYKAINVGEGESYLLDNGNLVAAPKYIIPVLDINMKSEDIMDTKTVKVFEI